MAAFFIIYFLQIRRVVMTTISLSTGWQHLHDISLITLQFQTQHVDISLYGAQVLSYFDGQLERLWCSRTAVWKQGAAIRGGIPICWPWFGACDPQLNPDQTKRTNHGLVRNRLWQISHWGVDADGAAVELSLEVTDIPWLSTSVRLKYTVVLNTAGLTVTLSTDESFVQQAALHSYFLVDVITETSVTGLPTQFQDKVSQQTVTDTEGRCSFTTEVDRIYMTTADELLLQAQSTFTIKQAGHDASIVWNPGYQKGSSAADIGEQWSEFVCVESASLEIKPKRLALTQQIPRSKA